MNTATRTISSRSQSRGDPTTALRAGTPGPEFALHSTPDQTVKLSGFRERPVVLGLNAERLMKDVLNGAYTARVRQDVRSGARQGVNGTPCFFINGARYDGTPGVEDLLAALTAGPHLTNKMERN